jgi:hypothetical protein
MKSFAQFAVIVASVTALFTSAAVRGQSAASAPLPEGVRAVWDLDKAWRQTTPTREEICLNGLWRWQPTTEPNAEPPTNRWGFFKVPGAWPGLSDYMQKDSQTVFRHPDWKDVSMPGITMAWYEREFEAPAAWTGRRIALTTDTLNSFATVYLDGHKAGELRFPGGELDLTDACRPGARHKLSLLVVAMPLQGVLRSYTDSASARDVKGEVRRRGLCGDVFLVGSPPGARVEDVSIETSVRAGEITASAAIPALSPEETYSLKLDVREHGNPVVEFRSPLFKASDLKDGRFRFSQKWRPERIWDLHTPTNQFEAVVSLIDGHGKILDVSAPERFGFRELWIDGRDFRLNGSRIYLSAEPLDNAQIGAALATYDAARETIDRLESFGINMVYTHNYDCQPGSHLGFEEILRAADDAGMLVSLTQPHFSHYEWKSADADRTNSYARHAEYYARVARNHPSVVFYSMSHNATGYEEDMNPDLIDGLHDPRDRWSSNNVVLALRAEAIVRKLDPGRIVYHHASGNLGVMHSINFYPNMAPIQELDDWFEHWANQGVKPVFTCEYGAPFTWDWTMYRGWRRGQREFGSAQVPWDFCVAEWNAQFFGDRAYNISEPEKANLRWEAKQFQAGKSWHRWDYPVEVGSPRLEERYPVFAKYTTDNWRAYRTWGVSGNSPWEYGHFWKLRDGVNRGREALRVDWDRLQRPGISPDYLADRFERMDVACARSDWIPTPAAEALYRNNMPLLAYIGGKPSAFTCKDHNFLAGQIVEKQIIIINNSRVNISGRWEWSAGLPQKTGHNSRFTLAAGEQVRIPIRIPLLPTLLPGNYPITAEVHFDNGEVQRDSFEIQVMGPPPAPAAGSRIALFDPRGETEAWLSSLGTQFKTVEANADLSDFNTLIVGKGALSPEGPAPAIARVRDGLKVIVFEQSAATLERRFGFRVAEYGLRTVFARIPDHPILAGINAENLRDWRGEATLSAPRLSYTLRPRYGSTVTWCGLPETRLWRCGNRGNVASVLIEKPPRGDFRPIVDGGFDLQYSPLLEYREGRGMVLFCQMDLSGRTESDPCPATIGVNILNYASAWKPSPRRSACYAGEPAGKTFLEALGISVENYAGEKLSSERILVAGPGAGQQLSEHKREIADWLSAGGRLLAFGLAQADMDSFLPMAVKTRTGEHIACWFDAQGEASFAAGIGPSDVHLRAPRDLALVVSGAATLGDGILARSNDGSILFCQLAPWQIDPKGPDGEQYNLRRTRRRAAVLAGRLLANLGAAGAAPVITRFNEPVGPEKTEQRWLSGLYIDQPEEWDDPYRFFRW